MIYQQANQLFKLLNNSLHNLIYKHKIVILIGEQKSLINIYYNGVISEHLLLDNQQIRYDNVALQRLIDQYRQAKIYFILDNTQVSIKYINLTSFESLINQDIVTRYAIKEFQDDELYAHKLLSYTPDGQTLNLFALCKINELINFWLDNIFNKKALNFGGIYFLPLELSHIIQKVSKACLNLEQQAEFNSADIQIFSFISQVSGIRNIVIQNRRILLNNHLKYPQNKSLQYVRGTIEQELTEVIANASHIADHDNELTTSVVLFANIEIVETLQATRFSNVNSQIIVATDTLINSQNQTNTANNYFFDVFLSDLVFQHRTFPAINRNLTNLQNLQKLNKVSTKILLYVTLLLSIIIIYFQIATFNHNYQITKVSEQYFKHNLEYTHIKENFTNIKHFDQIAELIFLQNRYKNNQILPINFLTNFLQLQTNNVVVADIHWSKVDSSIDDKFTTNINLIYISYKSGNDRDLLLQEINDYIKLLRNNFKDYEITYTCNLNNIRSHVQKVTIPITIVISN